MIDDPTSTSRYLGGAFNWSTTPQGDVYWRIRSGDYMGNSKVPLDDGDISFLKLLAGIKDDPFLLDPKNKEFC